MKSKIFILVFSFLTLIFPSEITKGIREGIAVSGNVIIPSLFPFTFCMIFLSNCNIGQVLPEVVTKKLFKLNSYEFFALFMSFLGGYPIGAKIISQMYENKKISKKNAELLINYSVNSGPVFAVFTVGVGVFSSKSVGLILLASHILSSIILALIFSKYKKFVPRQKNENIKALSFSENFTFSTIKTAESMFTICSYIIIFSFINSVISSLSSYIPPLKYLLYFGEISLGTTISKNVYLTSFLLGFGGLCVWFQVISIMKPLKPKINVFALSRILHGGFSVVFTKILVLIFNPIIRVGSNYKIVISSSASVVIALISMSILLVISLFSENNSGNIKEDLL